MPKKQVNEDTSPVELVAPVKSVEAKVTEPCWNCGKQLENNKCPNCGFDKDLLHNLNLEAEQSAKRQKELNKE